MTNASSRKCRTAGAGLFVDGTLSHDHSTIANGRGMGTIELDGKVVTRNYAVSRRQIPPHLRASLPAQSQPRAVSERELAYSVMRVVEISKLPQRPRGLPRKYSDEKRRSSRCIRKQTSGAGLLKIWREYKRMLGALRRKEKKCSMTISIT